MRSIVLRRPTITLLVCLLAAPALHAATPSFVNDVVPILTRYGCNQGACHGKGAGQNGFRLSLRGYAPELDHAWITREFLGRRISLSVPQESAFLRKPAGQASHEGGKLFDRNSRPYTTLLDWLKAGAPAPVKDEPIVTALEVSPGSRTLQPKQAQQLTVRAKSSDGQARDVTWLCNFDSNDAGMASVDPDGKVSVLRFGETAIRVSYQNLVAVVIITAPREMPLDEASRALLAKRNNFIDDHVFAKLAALRLPPSDLCDDATFLRRAFLDTLGVLPSPQEVRDFLADTRSNKRARLVDALLERPEFVDHWALFLGDLFQNRKERDHDVRGLKGVRSFHEWLRKQVRDNRPWNELARDVLTASGKTTDAPAVGYFVVTVGEHNEAARSEVVASVAQAFLGTRIGCAQCHNHPLERYTQDDYYHFAAFFSRIKMNRQDAKNGPTSLLVAGPDGKPAKGPAGVVQPRTGQFLKPQPLDRSPVTLADTDDPRVKLADWMTNPKNEYFSGAMVNRLWKHFLGTGLVDPVDDLRTSNPPTNPELWKALNQEFVSHKFDLKYLMRVILNSRTYQLDSATRPGNAEETRFYSHYYARRLPAEVLLDAVCQSTGVPEAFPGYPLGLRAEQLPDPTLKSYFLTVFGRSERVTACACERNGEVTMPQLLHLMNGESISAKVHSREGRLQKLMTSGKSADDILEEMFLLTMSRPLRKAERERIQKLQAAAGDTREFYGDLFWALLNAKEFSFNH
jgi:hypothetical protein